MSLRAFHIIFIIASVVLTLFVGLWGIREFAQEQNQIRLMLGILSFISAVALMIYGKKVFTKLRELP